MSPVITHPLTLRLAKVGAFYAVEQGAHQLSKKHNRKKVHKIMKIDSDKLDSLGSAGGTTVLSLGALSVIGAPPAMAGLLAGVIGTSIYDYGSKKRKKRKKQRKRQRRMQRRLAMQRKALEEAKMELDLAKSMNVE